jgi:hypothetical protein
VDLDKDFWQTAMQRPKPLERAGIIPFGVPPAISGNITPPALRTMATERGWSGHASVVTPDRARVLAEG